MAYIEPTKWMKQRVRVREILAGNRCVVASSVFDPLSARIGDDLGFGVGLMGGSFAALTALGAPYIALLTLSELADRVRRTCRAGGLSVIVDADHGYGNALNVMRTVEELENAGAAALTIEDTLLPAAFGSSGAAELISLDEGLGKVRAAVAARGDAGIGVFARTSAPAIEGLDKALVRLHAYERTGADALFLPGLKQRDELDRIAAAVTLPLVVASPHESLLDVDYPASRGAHRAAGHQPFFAAPQAPTTRPRRCAVVCSQSTPEREPRNSSTR